MCMPSGGCFELPAGAEAAASAIRASVEVRSERPRLDEKPTRLLVCITLIASRNRRRENVFSLNTRLEFYVTNGGSFYSVNLQRSTPLMGPRQHGHLSGCPRASAASDARVTQR